MHGFNCLIFAILVKFSFSHVTFPDVLETAIQNLRSKREAPCGEEIDLEQTGGVAEIQLRTELFNGTGFYRANEDCTWTLKTAQDHFMILKSDYFSVEISENCSMDYVEITEKGVGGTTSKYCGWDPLTYITFKSEIQLQFKSDVSFADMGFKFIIESSKRGRDDSKCIGSILGGEDSRIMNKDDLKEDCFYRIQAPRDKVITLELKMLNFGSASCEEESIIIYEGHSTRKPLGTVCGDSVLGILPYHASSMFIEYRNLLQQEGARFAIDYMFVEDNFTPAPVPSTTPSPAGGNNDCSRMYKGIDIGSGIVVYTAPKYESNTDCIVVVHNDIFPKHVVQVEFDYFSIKQSDNCIFDSLRIFSGISNDSGMLGGPYCGESLHGRTFLSPGNSLRLEFKTDVSLALKGFQAKISFVSNTECICNGNKMCIRQDFEKKCISGQICEGISCQNGGTCIKTGSEETCYCPKGFKGENCSQIEYIRVNGEKYKHIRFTEAPADRTIKKGEGHVEECKVEVPNGEEVEYNWYFQGAMIEPYNKKAGFGTHRGGILQIDVFSDKLAGNYSCFATTSGRTAEHTFEYRIFEECNVRPNQEGCDELEGSGIPCNDTGYGCCPDRVTAATGPNEEGCDISIVDPQPTTDTDVDINVDGSDRTGTDLPGIAYCPNFPVDVVSLSLI
ncbi:bone morphogenetic protein 1-like [Ruditapes philippinarum]|uniref:bone morphogenetic protein 1-like n=1 Tax=Ruditapes philippinarum TaxID=129788 RepID=UPI00295C2913|nr:bone morphogenetic protein 1-like [Ruditapes philippinarum]